MYLITKTSLKIISFRGHGGFVDELVGFKLICQYVFSISYFVPCEIIFVIKTKYNALIPQESEKNGQT